MSLEASSFNCAFILFLGLFTGTFSLYGYIRGYDSFPVCSIPMQGLLLPGNAPEAI